MTVFRFSLVLSCLGAWSAWSLQVEAQVINSHASQHSPAVHASAGEISGMQDDEGVTQATWLGIPLPRISMPQISMPTISMPDMTPVTAPVKSGLNKVAMGTRSAWEGTKEMFSFTNNSTQTRHYTQPQGPTFWQRLFGHGPQQPQGPQTVGEWMSQPRLDP